MNEELIKRWFELFWSDPDGFWMSWLYSKSPEGDEVAQMVLAFGSD